MNAYKNIGHRKVRTRVRTKKRLAVVGLALTMSLTAPLAGGFESAPPAVVVEAQPLEQVWRIGPYVKICYWGCVWFYCCGYFFTT